MQMKKILTVLLIILLKFNSYSQKTDKIEYLICSGIFFSYGTHFNKAGIFLQSTAYYKSIQINTRFSINKNISEIGEFKTGSEFQSNFGFVFSFGKQNSIKRSFLIPTLNNTRNPYGFGYSYNIYRDTRQTSQETGTFGISIKNFFLETENDLFGKPASDKFRTGALSVSYIKNYDMISVNTLMWTGNPKRTEHVLNSDYPSNYGYKKINEGKYGKFSYGILNIQYSKLTNLTGTYSVSAGIDSEKVRHVFQN